MNIYFACSITGGRKDEDVYRAIVEALLNDGHNVPTAHLAKSIVVHDEKFIDPVEVYTRDTTWISESDALVAEISTPSHGVGYEVAYALNLGKPVLCCHAQGTTISKMISGNTDERLTVEAYETVEEVIHKIRDFLNQVNR